MARLVLRLLAATSLFVLAGTLARATVLDDGAGLAMIWPAAGIAALWLGSSTRRTLPFDLTALAVATFAVNASTGADVPLALVLVVTNLAQVLVFVVLVRAWLPGLFGFGGANPLERLRELGLIVSAAVVATLLGALLGALGAAVLHGSTEVPTFAAWWGRNAVATIVVVAFGVLAGQPLVTAGSWPAARARLRAALTPASTLRAVDAGVLVLASAGLYLLLFLSPDAAPLLFLALVMSVWAGIRFPPLAVLLHGVATGATSVVLTLHGIGPFADVADVRYRALIAQVFVAMSVLQGLALAFSRVERDRANAGLREARAAADERAELLAAVLESMKEGVVVVADTGRVLLANTASRSLAGLVDSRDHIRPAAAYGLFHDNGMPLRDDEMASTRALAGETVAPFDLHVRSDVLPGGRVLEVSGQPLQPGPDGTPRAIVNLRDVTLDRQHRDTLASFAGVVAHDLSNPLAIVDGWAEALAEEFCQGPVAPAVGSVMLTRIQRSTAHMREFIADLLSYTVARDQSLRPSVVDLSALVRSLAALRNEGGRSAHVDVEDGLLVWADAGLVRQLVDNLLGNAIKYVAPGRRPVVEVTGSVVGDWLEVRVSDNGIGIPEQDREAVFESFHRAHPDGVGGTGLGLAICRRIVDRHGGTIHAVPAAYGTGTAVVFRLPRYPGALTAPLVPAQATNA